MKRLTRLLEILDSHDLDSMLVDSASNRRYLSGFTGSTGWLIISAQKSYLAVDSRYVEQAKNEANGSEILYIKGDVNSWLPALTVEMGIKRLGIESDHLSLSDYQSLNKAFQGINKAAQIIPVQNIVESLRVVKDERELLFVQEACQIADKAMIYAQSSLRPGITEKQLAWELESFIRQQGSDSIPFEIIVASGTNSAMPHARPTDRAISEGEPVTIDLGARVNGYCSDLTRSFIIGKDNADFNKIYNIVLGAQLTALSVVKSGMNAAEIDSIVRDIISNAGYRELFGHGLGHGVGLDTHELPRLRNNSVDVLLDGMVFTVEPGVYMPGWGGIRIEDTVTIKNGKLKSLTEAGKKAQV